MGNLFRNLLTGTDNQSWELGRVLWGLFGVALIAFQGFAMWAKVPTNFSPVEFAGGSAAILAAGGWGIAKKDAAHPSNQSGDAA